MNEIKEAKDLIKSLAYEVEDTFYEDILEVKAVALLTQMGVPAESLKDNPHLSVMVSLARKVIALAQDREDVHVDLRLYRDEDRTTNDVEYGMLIPVLTLENKSKVKFPGYLCSWNKMDYDEEGNLSKIYIQGDQEHRAFRRGIAYFKYLERKDDVHMKNRAKVELGFMENETPTEDSKLSDSEIKRVHARASSILSYIEQSLCKTSKYEVSSVAVMDGMFKGLPKFKVIGATAVPNHTFTEIL